MKRSVILLALLAAGLSWAQTTSAQKPVRLSNLIHYIDQRRDKNVAAFWSLAFPGAGHIYAKKDNHFLLMLGLRAGSMIAIWDSDLKPDEKTGLTWGVGIATLLLDVLSASRNAGRYNAELKQKYGFEFTLSQHSAGGRLEVQLSSL